MPEPSIACRLWSDFVPAVLIGIRSALAVGITCAFWFATAWPNGPAAVVVAAVVCSLLASLEQPDAPHAQHLPLRSPDMWERLLSAVAAKK